jgi:phosphatidylglycerophosphate synthase
MGPLPSAASGPLALLYFASAGDAAAACAPVAGLPVGFRALMAALRAGCRAVGVPAALRRTAVERAILRSPAARRSAIWLDGALPAQDGAVLLLPATAVLPPSSVAAVLAAGPTAALASAPIAAPVALVPAGAAGEVAGLLARGGAAGGAVRAILDDARARPVAGSWCVAAADGPGRREAERRLFADLGSAIDTRFDTAVHRPCSRVLTRAALRLGLSANAVSLAGLVLGLAAAVALARPAAGAALLGLALYFLSVVLDHSDGEVARLGMSESRLGEWLDVSIDTVVHVCCALAMGAAAERAADWGLWPGVGAAAGFAASALVTKTAPAPAAAGAPGRAVTALGTRDGFYILLGLHVLAASAAPSAIAYLVTLAAIGSHVFWPTSLALRWRPDRRRAAAGAAEAPSAGRGR